MNRVTKQQVLVQITHPPPLHGILFLFLAKRINPQRKSGGTYAPFQRRGVVYLLTPPCRGLRVSVSRCLECWYIQGNTITFPTCRVANPVVKHVLTRRHFLTGTSELWSRIYHIYACTKRCFPTFLLGLCFPLEGNRPCCANEGRMISRLRLLEC